MSDAHASLEPDAFAGCVIDWQRLCGRHDLPWQNTRDPYRIWLSEIMLQQTQVSTVIPYFLRFMARFPDVAALAAAPEDEVLALWSGLGYYARARHLHRAARQIMTRRDGRFPQAFDDIAALPGVGPSTAGAIAVFAFGQTFPILDGNVKRVLARCFGIEGHVGEARVQRTLWALSARLLPDREVEAYTQGLMDLGAAVCVRRRPHCGQCPLARRCVAYASGRVAELPAPRPRRLLPRRRTTMLVLLNDGAVLLEKRPGAGVWGGLWSFPEIADEADLPQVCLTRYGVDPAQSRRLPGLAHAFTHYQLTITPWLCLVRCIVDRAEQPGRAWWPIEEALAGAIPAPVRTILERLDSVGFQQLGEPGDAAGVSADFEQ